MTTEQIIAKLRVLSRKVKRLEKVRHDGRDWRLIVDEVEKYVENNIGVDAWQAVHSALNPSRIGLRMDPYPIGDNVDPQWKAERVLAVQTELEILIRDIESGYLVPHGEHKKQDLTEPIAIFDAVDLHPAVSDAARSLFATEHYAQAIFEAFKVVNNLVKKVAGQDDLDGKALMARVFGEQMPMLALNPLATRSDRDEQEGFKFLYMGAMLGIRNPKAHDTTVQTDALRTLHYLALASLLATRAEEASASGTVQSASGASSP